MFEVVNGIRTIVADLRTTKLMPLVVITSMTDFASNFKRGKADHLDAVWVDGRSLNTSTDEIGSKDEVPGTVVDGRLSQDR